MSRIVDMVRTVTPLDVARLYVIRLDALDGVTDGSVADFCNGLDGAYLVVQEAEKADNVHYHGLFTSKIPLGTLRVRVKKAWPSLVGNKAYSLKELEGGPEGLAKYHKYMCKGTRETGPVIVARSGLLYTDQWVGEQHAAFWAHPLSEAHEYKKDKRSVTEVIWSKVEGLPRDEVKPRRVARIIVDAWTKVGKPYDMFGVRRLMTVIMSRYDPKFRKLVVEEAVATDLFRGWDDEQLIREEHNMLEFEF